MANLTINSKIPSIRSLTPEVKKALVTINKDKKRWYTTANKEAGGKLFKTSFHDYAHSAPGSIQKQSNTSLDTPNLGLTLAEENIARHYEDSVLQGLPVAYRGANDTAHRDLLKRGQEGVLGEAYGALQSLGKYSTSKKKGIPIEEVTGAKMILNKFHFSNGSTKYF